MKLFSNPIVLRMALSLFCFALAFCVGTLLVRRMRRNLSQEGSFETPSRSLELVPLKTYNSVIQELKQQKHELLSTQQVERRRAKTSESISAAVFSNLSTGVIFIAPNLLVRQANAAAKQILGFASAAGMNIAEIFRQATPVSPAESQGNIAELIAASLRESMPCSKLQAQYTTPAGEPRILEITLTAVSSPSGESVGAACLINDRTELARFRKEQELRGEMSAEMALALRGSVAAILDYAQQVAVNRDPQLIQLLATDIASEAASLDHTIGGFLAGARAAGAGEA